MTRKMLKEEQELRSWYSIMEFKHLNKKQYFRDITALVRACYEDAAKVGYEEALRHHSGNANHGLSVAACVVAAIWSRKQEGKR